MINNNNNNIVLQRENNNNNSNLKMFLNYPKIKNRLNKRNSVVRAAQIVKKIKIQNKQHRVQFMNKIILRKMELLQKKIEIEARNTFRLNFIKIESLNQLLTKLIIKQLKIKFLVNMLKIDMPIKKRLRITVICCTL